MTTQTTFTSTEQAQIDDMVARIQAGEMDRSRFIRTTERLAVRSNPSPERQRELAARRIVEARTASQPAAPTPQLTACPSCGQPAQHETAPNREGYITCGHCAAITFVATAEEAIDCGPLGACGICGRDAWLTTAIGLLCWDHEFMDPAMAGVTPIEPPPPTKVAPFCTAEADAVRREALSMLESGADYCTVCGLSHRPTQCPQIGALLMCPPRTGPSVSLSPVEALRLALDRGVFGLDTKALLTAALAAADEAALRNAEQLACARQHVNETFQRWQFEAKTTECPF